MPEFFFGQNILNIFAVNSVTANDWPWFKHLKIKNLVKIMTNSLAFVAFINEWWDLQFNLRCEVFANRLLRDINMNLKIYISKSTNRQQHDRLQQNDVELNNAPWYHTCTLISFLQIFIWFFNHSLLISLYCAIKIKLLPMGLMSTIVGWVISFFVTILVCGLTLSNISLDLWGN